MNLEEMNEHAESMFEDGDGVYLIDFVNLMGDDNKWTYGDFPVIDKKDHLVSQSSKGRFCLYLIADDGVVKCLMSNSKTGLGFELHKSKELTDGIEAYFHYSSISEAKKIIEDNSKVLDNCRKNGDKEKIKKAKKNLNKALHVFKHFDLKNV